MKYDIGRATKTPHNPKKDEPIYAIGTYNKKVWVSVKIAACIGFFKTLNEDVTITKIPYRP